MVDELNSANDLRVDCVISCLVSMHAAMCAGWEWQSTDRLARGAWGSGPWQVLSMIKSYTGSRMRQLMLTLACNYR